MGEAVMPDDGTENDEDGDVTVKVRKGRPRVNGTAAETPEGIKGFATAFRTAGRELNVERRCGPKGLTQKTYRGRPIQTGMCKSKLPPDALDNLVQALDELGGGGWYAVWPDNAKKEEVLWPVKVPGRPKPLDKLQALDEEADIEEGLDDGEAIPHLGGLGASPAMGGRLPPLGGFSGGAFPGGTFPGHSPFMGAPRPGMIFDAASRTYVPMAPFHDPHARDVEKERDELKRKVEMDPLLRRVEDIEKERGRSQAPAESPFKGIMEMMALQAAEAEKQRKHAMDLETARRDREDAARAALVALEREERKDKAAAEEARQQRLADREREDRLEREKDRTAMFSMVMKVMSDGAGKKSNGTDDIVKLIQATQGVKDLMTPPGKSETAELIEAGTAGAKEVVGALGDAFRGRGDSKSNPNAPPTDERLQMLDVMEYMAQLAEKKIRPMHAFTAFTAFCAGRGYDAKKMVEKLAGYSDAASVQKLQAELAEQSKSSLVPEQYRPKLADVAGLLGNADNQAWLVEVGGIAKG